jgi:hypothetical protein
MAMSSKPESVMNSPDRQKPGNHPAARPGHDPDPRVQKPTRRLGEPELQAGAPSGGSAGSTGDSRG